VSTVSQADLVRIRNGESEFVPSDEPSGAEHQADIVVKGRNVEVPDHFRIHVSEKLGRLERFHPAVYLFDVELHHERNRRQSKSCQRIEITARGKGPVIRAEASSDSFYSALEMAVDKLESRFRRSRDRRKVHHGTRTPVSVAEVTAELAREAELAAEQASGTEAGAPEWNGQGDSAEAAGPGRIVRTKVHKSKPMTVDAALYEMELVGHDFYLFHDSETDCPSVVYRRRAFDYGLIRLA
jgi:ribosomal subunit interface protein